MPDIELAARTSHEGEHLLVVGIGASADGSEAIERFLQRIPSDSGMAYVLVQDRSPEHESLPAEILGHATRLPVGTATDGECIERDHVYVAPPGPHLVVEGGALRLALEPESDGLPVDAFLRSLAEDQGENAIGIVLSGSGSDGALGIAAVKEHGGNTFAQVPGEARYEGMPAAAIATGMVEHVLPAAEIPAALVELAAERRRHPSERARAEEEGVLFRRREVGRRRVPPPRRATPLVLSPPCRACDPGVKSAADRSREIVLEEYSSPSVVVDARGEVRYYWGANLPRYLPPRAGAPLTNLLHLVRRELRVEVSAALANAARQGEPVTYRDVEVEVDGVQHRLNIVARPLPPTEHDVDDLCLVVFQELQAAPAAHGTPLDAPTRERHRQLERELESTREHLQATIDELENANDALRASNEQLQAMNEELSSANEEQQTSQEELQSINEKLNALNADLSRKVDELERVHADVENLLRSTQVATIFLDRQGRIARFTPEATAAFRLADGDVGRPLSDFAAGFDAQDVPQEAARVLETLAPVERTIGLAGEKRWFLMRMHPYRTRSGSIGGVVVSFVDVTKLKETEAALQQAVAHRERAEHELREADRRKDEFLAVLSHELRNPLAPIRSSLHVLERAPADASAAQRGQQIITRQVGYLARLVDDLLDATRISRGKLEIERQPLDLRELAQRTAEDHRNLLTARGVALEIALPDSPLWIEGDATRLAQVIGNLLHNATKFTSRGDLVRLSLEAVDDVALLRVRDTGVGIEPALTPRLFQPFTQADTTLNRRLGGLGLGLALVKGLVEMHGGTVAASSAGRGLGTEFVVRIPLAAAAPARTAVAPAPPPQPRRVLVIDDNVDAAESLRIALEMEGHEVAVAHDGPSGLERAREVAPEVVLCDIGLPGMDGYAVAKALRHAPALRDTFIVALTGHALADDRRSASEAGFDAHLTKPATIAEIEQVIARAARRPPARAEAPALSPPPAMS